jgi:hypothetical protein
VIILKKKVFVTIMASTIVASVATGAYGATKLQEIKAYLNPAISIKVDGVPTQLKDSSGLNIVPITYKNTTYLPVRAVSDALNVAVHYDTKTDTVNLGEKIEGMAISKGFKDMYHTKDPQHTTYKNKDYKEAYYNNSEGNRSMGFMLYPKKQYQTLYLQIAAIDEPIEKLIIKNSSNNIVLKTVDLINPEQEILTVDVNIGGVEGLYIYADLKKEGKVFIPLTTSYYK